VSLKCQTSINLMKDVDAVRGMIHYSFAFSSRLQNTLQLTQQYSYE
jgi:hypothetical protein